MTEQQLPQQIKIVEVSPRDGLQNETGLVDVKDKVKLIEMLSAAGVKHIEATGFVSPKWVPQLADAAAVCAALKPQQGVHYSALTPNMKGFEAALTAGIKEVAVFTAASQSFTQKNINCSIEESFQRFEPILQEAKRHNIKVRGYVSCVLGCPYQGEVNIETVAEVTQKLIEMGCYEVSLGDTIGVGTPTKAKAMLAKSAERVGVSRLALHFHDTWGQALANILACLPLGVSTIDAAVGGLGGCPYAKGASGNVSTEDLLYMLHGMNIETGIDLPTMVKAGRFISSVLGKPTNSQVSQALS